MRISPLALVLGPLLLTGLAACDTTGPVGSRAAMIPSAGMNDYQRQLRAAEGRGGSTPFSIPPEAAGAPMAGPARVAPAPPAAGAIDPRPDGVAANVFTPVPFGQRQLAPGANVPPTGTAEVVTVAAVPTGPATGPNVVAFALQTTHSVGTERFRRNNPFRWMRWEANCRAFPSQDAAQEAFLAAGGPERDRGNLDPDGDGFACWWDPAVFRSAARVPTTVIE